MEKNSIDSCYANMGKPVKFSHEEIKLVVLEKVRFGLRDSWNTLPDFGEFGESAVSCKDQFERFFKRLFISKNGDSDELDQEKIKPVAIGEKWNWVST